MCVSEVQVHVRVCATSSHHTTAHFTLRAFERRRFFICNMTERVRSMMKSASTRGSVAHLGTTPCKYHVEFVISHVDKIKTADEVCIVWDRRGKSVHTQMAKVVNNKATFRETLAMETTLFRRASPGIKMGEPPKAGEECKFDEKKAKFALRRSTPTGKSVGKISLNLADYVKSVNGTVFADLKLSNGSVVSVKIISTFLHVGKKDDNKADNDNGSDGESVLSELQDANAGAMDNDSVFGDDASSNASLVIEVERIEENADGSKKRTPVKSSDSKSPPTFEMSLSPVSNDGNKTPSKSSKSDSKRVLSKRASAAGLKESISTRSRHRRKDRTEKDELRKEVEKLKAENAKLKASKKAAVEEIDALRDELQSMDEIRTLPSSPTSAEAMKRKTEEEMKSLRKQIKELKGQNLGLVEELEELHLENQGRSGTAGNEEVAELKEQIKQLEITLRREPKFMDVVNELKVAKVSLALANMEKEQAQFALFQFKGNSPRL